MRSRMHRMKYPGGRHACAGLLHVFARHHQPHLPHAVVVKVRIARPRQTLTLRWGVNPRRTMGLVSGNVGQARCTARQRRSRLRVRPRHRVGRVEAKIECAGGGMAMRLWLQCPWLMTSRGSRLHSHVMGSVLRSLRVVARHQPLLWRVENRVLAMTAATRKLMSLRARLSQ